MKTAIHFLVNGVRVALYTQIVKPRKMKVNKKANPVSPTRLLIEERRRAILELLEARGRVTVEELSRHFQVSAVTVRDDLETLSSRGALVRSHGGAIPHLSPKQDYPLTIKRQIHQPAKSRIARAAARLIQPSQTVIIDSGTTANALAMELAKHPPEALRVVTHSLDVAAALANSPGISVVMIGGVLRHISHSFVGPQAERMLLELRADHFFLAVDGFDLENGLSTPDILEAQVNACMVRVSREVTVIADASKFGRCSMSVIAAVECVKRVVTDQRLDSALAAGLQARGIEVILAE
jgi:DeoR family transcriptional regulator of aga operon